MSTRTGILDLQDLNEQMRDRDPVERIDLAHRLFGDDLVLATSFGPTSAALLSLVQAVNRRIRVLNVRHGHETPEMLEYAGELQRRWDLHLRVYQGETLPIPEEDTPAFTEFQFRAKVQPFREALRHERARAWLSGVMRCESPARRDFDYVMVQNGLPVIYPILDWTPAEVAGYCTGNGIPTPTSYFDPTKGRSQDLECGLHRPAGGRLE